MRMKKKKQILLLSGSLHIFLNKLRSILKNTFNKRRIYFVGTLLKFLDEEKVSERTKIFIHLKQAKELRETTVQRRSKKLSFYMEFLRHILHQSFRHTPL